MERNTDFNGSDENNEKKIDPTSNKASFISGGKIVEVTLTDLSNLIDVVGMTSNDPLWNNYRQFDFNNNGVIDVYDVSTLAKFIP